MASNKNSIQILSAPKAREINPSQREDVGSSVKGCVATQATLAYSNFLLVIRGCFDWKTPDPLSRSSSGSNQKCDRVLSAAAPGVLGWWHWQIGSHPCWGKCRKEKSSAEPSSPGLSALQQSWHTENLQHHVLPCLLHPFFNTLCWGNPAGICLRVVFKHSGWRKLTDSVFSPR